MADSTDITASAVTRRRMLQAGIAGGAVAGAAWVTPSVLSIDAAAAASACATFDTFNWTAYNSGDSGLSGNDNRSGGVQITITTGNPGGQGTAPNFVVQTEAATGARFGNRTRWWQMRQNASGDDGTAAQETATFAFTRVAGGASVALSQFSFNLLDIDWQNDNGNGWRDEVWITDTSGNPIAFTGTKVAAPPTGPSGAGTAASPYRGESGNLANNSQNGNVAIAFTAPVSGFRVNYRNRAGAGNNFEGSIMRVGIADLRWCRIT